MPNLMVALPNIGDALCSMPQSLADAHYLTAMKLDKNTTTILWPFIRDHPGEPVPE